MEKIVIFLILFPFVIVEVNMSCMNTRADYPDLSCRDLQSSRLPVVKNIVFSLPIFYATSCISCLLR